jgi:hypothetical protein
MPKPMSETEPAMHKMAIETSINGSNGTNGNGMHETVLSPHMSETVPAPRYEEPAK